MSSSISRIALKAMFWRLLFVVSISAFWGYWYNYEVIRESTMEYIERYVQERIARESIQFNIAEKNLLLLKQKFLEGLENSKFSTTQKFSQLVEKLPDGTYRSLHRDPERIQILIPQHASLSLQGKKNLVVAENLMQQFGIVWSSQFYNLWMASKEDYGITYWPSDPGLLLDVPAEFTFLEHEYMTVGLPRNNPSGEQRWAGPYLDKMSEDWMISLNQPVYYKGEYQLSFGMDIPLEEFNARSSSNLMKDTYNVIFNQTGRLIVHPLYMDKIFKSDGQLLVKDSGDPDLIKIYQQAISNYGKVLYDDELKLFMGVGKIPNMDWFFVLVYPEAKLKSIASKTAVFAILVGLISLLVELLMLSNVLKRYVSKPIHHLVSATKEIAEGNTKTMVEVVNNDEIGQLARSFNQMSSKIEERDELLRLQAANLEEQVKERSKELDLQRAKAVEASKMATLGEISAAIAHEINNPLAIIRMTAEMLKRQHNNQETDREKTNTYIQRIDATVQKIFDIIRALKSYSRKSEFDTLVPVSLQDIVRNTLILCEETLKQKNIHFSLSAIPDIKVLCREGDIVQTLVNLIQNAIDALENHPQKDLSLTFEQMDEQVSIILEDSGPGIPDQIADKIMNPFFTTKEVGKGTGLGLFISSGLIHANKGKLILDQSGNKTRFIVVLNTVV